MTRRASDEAATPAPVRVVMIKSATGSQDGLRVERYRAGQEYELEASLAASFIKTKKAKPAQVPEPAKAPDGGTDNKGGKGPDENK